MKTIRLIIAGLVMTMGFSSCSSLFYDAKVDVLNSIQKGMSRQEVTKILGTPEYRRFDREKNGNIPECCPVKVISAELRLS